MEPSQAHDLHLNVDLVPESGSVGFRTSLGTEDVNIAVTTDIPSQEVHSVSIQYSDETFNVGGTYNPQTDTQSFGVGFTQKF